MIYFTLNVSDYYCSTTAPQPFRSEVDVDLTFHRDGTPIVEVSFEVYKFFFMCVCMCENYYAVTNT